MSAMIDQMVNRFLAWKLPADFGPDAGIKFTPHHMQQPYGPYWPTGTNLFTAPQAAEMFRHCASGIDRVVCDVLAEHQRQIESEGQLPERDDEHCLGEWAMAAACCAGNAGGYDWQGGTPSEVVWPWGSAAWKPGTAREDLVKAAALIFEEIKRIDRSEEANNA